MPSSPGKDARREEQRDRINCQKNGIECDAWSESVRDLIDPHRRNVIGEAIMDDEIRPESVTWIGSF